MKNDKIIFYVNDKLNLYYIPYLVRNFKVNARNKLNYNNKAPLTFFQYKRPHLEYSC